MQRSAVHLSTHIKTGDCFGVVLISGQNAARLEGGRNTKHFKSFYFTSIGDIRRKLTLTSTSFNKCL